MGKWFFQLIRRYKKSLFTIVGLQVVAAFLFAILPFLFQQLIEIIINAKNGSVLEKAILPVSSLLLVYLIITVIQGLTGVVGTLLSSNMLKQIQMNFIEHAAALPVSYFRQERVGELVTRFNHDVGQVQNLLAGVGPVLIKELLCGVFLLAAIFWLGPLGLALAIVLVVLASFAFAYKANRWLIRFAEKQRKQWSEINHNFDEVVRGIETIKGFNAEARVADRFQRATDQYRNTSKRYGLHLSIYGPFGDLAIKIGMLSSLVLAILYVSNGVFTPSDFLVYFFCATLLSATISNIVNGIFGVQPLLIGLKNLNTYFASGVEAVGSNDVSVIPVDSIEFKKVSVKHSAGSWMFRDFSGTFTKGKLNLLQGPNGSGKSTLLDVLLGYMPIAHGEIRVNGQQVTQQDLVRLRKRISLISGNQYLFEGTVLENMLLANPGITSDELIREGIFLSAIWLNKRIEPDGRNLSDGERQKIMLARTVVAGSDIILLDEPFAHMDKFAQRKLVKALQDLAKQKLVVLIYHESSVFPVPEPSNRVFDHVMEVRG